MSEAIVRMPFDLPYEGHFVSFRTDGKTEDDNTASRHEFELEAINFHCEQLKWRLDFTTWKSQSYGVTDNINGKFFTKSESSVDDPSKGFDFTQDSSFDDFVTDQLSQKDTELNLVIQEKETTIVKERRNARIAFTVGAVLTAATIKFGIDGHFLSASGNEPEFSGYDALTLLSLVGSFSALMSGSMSQRYIRESREEITNANGEKQRLNVIAEQIKTNGIIFE